MPHAPEREGIPGREYAGKKAIQIIFNHRIDRKGILISGDFAQEEISAKEDPYYKRGEKLESNQHRENINPKPCITTNCATISRAQKDEMQNLQQCYHPVPNSQKLSGNL